MTNSMTYGYEATTGRFNSLSWNITDPTNENNKTGLATYSYLQNSELISQLTPSPQAIISYSYEPNRNLRTQVKNQYGTAVVSQYDYQYDQLGRRTNMTTIGSAPWGTPNLQPATTSYETNNLNQFTQVTSDQSPVTSTLSYDNDGNLTQTAEGSTGTKYTYDAENRLIAVEPQTPTSGTTKVEFAYDYMGRRVEKKVFGFVSGDWQLKTDSWFLYDGWNLIRESTTITGQEDPIEKYYICGLDLSQSLQGAGGVGGLLATAENGETFHYFYDGNGNVAQIVKASDGSIAAHYEYDPYGKILTQSGLYADQNPYRFSTKYFDRETELLYYGYRHYSPSLGRWISRDPLEEEGGINLYGFVNNNPINDVDFLGLTDPVPSPGIKDQWNPFGQKGATGQENYTQWFNLRFPKTVQGAIATFLERIKEKACNQFPKRLSTIPPLTNRQDSVDIRNPDMSRFGDKPQSAWERWVKIGVFQFKTDQVSINWKNGCCFTFSTVAYVEEHTGANDFPNPLAKPRIVRMAEWPLSGDSCCSYQ